MFASGVVTVIPDMIWATSERDNCKVKYVIYTIEI